MYKKSKSGLTAPQNKIERNQKHMKKNNFIWNTNNILKPQNTSQKSFYKKATYDIVENDERKTYTLFSYNTFVLEIVIDKQNINNSYYEVTEYTGYSRTTLRHVKEFLLQFYPLDTFEKAPLTSSNIFKYAKNNQEVA